MQDGLENNEFIVTPCQCKLEKFEVNDTHGFYQSLKVKYYNIFFSSEECY